MARIDMRIVANKTGVTYDATKTQTIYAEDILAIKEAIDDGTSGINTEQLEIGGTIAINSSGLIQNGTGVYPQKQQSTGADCSGSDGDANRVLTLSNTKTTKQVIVNAGGTFLFETNDYTVTHNSTNSTITFLNKLADNTNIEVIYFS